MSILQDDGGFQVHPTQTILGDTDYWQEDNQRPDGQLTGTKPEQVKECTTVCRHALTRFEIMKKNVLPIL